MLIKRHSFPSRSIPDTPDFKANVFLDIETTGFHRTKSIIYLIGCGVICEKTMEITQWFNNDGKSEGEMLLAFLTYCHDLCQGIFSDLNLITFNGERFDLPFLAKHFALHEISDKELKGANSTDLYRNLLPFQKAFGLEKGKQKNWERFMGIDRKDRYDGGQLIRLYKQYLTGPEESLLHILLLHNYEDILGMGEISALFAYQKLFQSEWTVKDVLPLTSIDVPSLASKEEQEGVRLLCLLPFPLPVPFFIFQEDYAIEGKEDQLIITICCKETVMKHYYKDYHNYYYLPQEDYAVHKSIGCYVDRQNRQNATAATCYSRLEGIFFPIPPKCSRHGISLDPQTYQGKTFYQREFAANKTYLEFGELFSDYSSTQQFLNQYLKDILKYILICGQ